MSAFAVLTASERRQSPGRSHVPGDLRLPLAMRWSLAVTAVVVGLGFFVAEHDLNVSRAISYTQDEEQMEVAATGGNALRRAAFFGIASWGMGLLFSAQSRLKPEPLLAGGLAILLGLAAISFLWAEDQGMCLRRLSSLACCAIGAAGIARALTLREIAWLAVFVFGGLAMVGILAELRLGTFRPWSADYRFAGTVHPNTQAAALATFCVAAFCLARGSTGQNAWIWTTFAIGLLLLVLTKSRTTTAGIFLAIAVGPLLETRIRTKIGGALAALWFACAAVWLLWSCGFDLPGDFRDALLLGRAEESDTLSGRAFIWPEVLYFAQQRLLLGYGYESFWTPAHIETISSNLGWGLREAHNAYLESLLSLGIVGLTTFLFVAASAIGLSIRGFRATRDPMYFFPLGMTVFALINAGCESGMVVVNLVSFVLSCCLFRLALFEGQNTGRGNKILDFGF
jgi:exopolysaccharide production protein ExoQ